MSFQLSSGPIEGAGTDAVSRDGAVTTFVGTVRDHNEGRAVTALEYEVYDELALSEGARVVDEALERFSITSASCTHRVGLLRIGDVAIRVDVAGPHRKAAFQACRYIVDEVKRRVPIWKKEHYAAGESEWLNVVAPADRAAYYSRQTRLPEVGDAGQESLAAAKVLVVGAGGLGCSALQYLASAGVGTIGICEHDRLEESNLHRQTLYAHGEVGQQKGALAVERIRSLNPFISVALHDWALTPTTAQSLIDAYDIVLDCTDNFQTKFLVNDACVSAGKTLIQASIYQYEGQLLAIHPDGPCLRCLWPQTPDEGCVGSCAEVGVLGFVPGVFGTLQAAEAIKHILEMPSALVSRMLILNLLDYSTQVLCVPKDPNCPTCGSGIYKEPPWLIHAEELNGACLIDIRDPDEVADVPLAVASEHIPGHQLGSQTWDREKRYVLICARGSRSGQAAQELHQRGVVNVFSLAGGLETLQRAGVVSP